MLPHAEGIYYRICVQFLGGICRDTGDWDGAEKWFQKSLAHAEAADNLGGIGTSLGLLGDIARKRGAYDKAEALFNQSLAVQTELGDRAGMATSWGSLGENELERGNLEAAETWLIKALLVFEELQMPDMLAEVNWVLARIYHAKGEPSKAQEYFDHAHEPYTQLGAKADLARIDQEANANG